MSNVIELKHIKHFFKEKEVLKDIRLKIKKGEIFGLLGPSGAGKTTLINIMTGQLKASGGECLINGVSSSNFSGEQYKKMGIMMDRFGLYERMSCYDNLKFYKMIDGNNATGNAAGIEKVLKEVGLLDAKKRQVANLSKGMKTRLAFARAVLRKPEILFLDEPTSGLDPNTTEEIHKMILAEKERGTTIFLTTHNMHEAEKLCDNIALLNDGKIVEYGKPMELCRKYNHQKKYRLHLKSGEDIELRHETDSIEKIVFYLQNDELETIHTAEPDLETIFMELTGRKID